jgi:hypothetical protein
MVTPSVVLVWVIELRQVELRRESPAQEAQQRSVHLFGAGPGMTCGPPSITASSYGEFTDGGMGAAPSL